MTINLAGALELRTGAQIFEFDSSAKGKTYRIELTDGRHFQLNEKLYHLLDSLRKPLALTDLAAEFQRRTGEAVAIEQLQQLGGQLAEQGIIVEAGQAPALTAATPQQATSLMGLHYRWDLFSAERLAPIAQALQVCFTKPAVAVALIVIAITQGMTFAKLGFPPNLDLVAVSWPLLFVLVLISIFFHEMGHLAACRRWECPHGPLGFGLYFFNPVFYVDVTAAWRLNRWQRAVVDAGGIYVQLLCAPFFLALYWATADLTYLVAIGVINLLILGNLEPMMKLDGYWLLSDLTGVPNLHNRTGEAMRYLLTWSLWRLGLRKIAPAASSFSEWSSLVRSIVLVYVAFSIILIPLFVVALVPMLVQMVTTYPGLWRTAFETLLQAIANGNFSAVLNQFSVLFLPTLALLQLGLMLKTMVGQLWKRRVASGR